MLSMDDNIIFDHKYHNNDCKYLIIEALSTTIESRTLQMCDIRLKYAQRGRSWAGAKISLPAPPVSD
jgi:hypothetical protein